MCISWTIKGLISSVAQKQTCTADAACAVGRHLENIVRVMAVSGAVEVWRGAGRVEQSWRSYGAKQLTNRQTNKQNN